MKWLESTIAAVSPGWAAKRAFYRVQLDLARGYDGAKGGRRQAGWSRPSTSANGEIANAGTKLRNSARDLVRNHPNAKKAKRSYIANMVGTGITPRANTGNKRLNKKIDEAFAAWCAGSDADGQLDFYGQQGLVAGTMFESGEVLARYRDRERKGGEIPLKVQLLEPDYLDSSRFGTVAGSATSYIAQGIEFNERRERLAYYLWSEHPGDMAAGLRLQSLKSLRVPADQIAHVFRVDRPGQIRGVTEFAAGMQKVYDLAEYEEAELVRKKIGACFVAFIKQSGANATPLSANSETDEKDRRIEHMSPGMLQYLGLDQSVEFGTPPRAEGYNEFTVGQWHAIAAGWGMTYEELTGDFSKVNYSSFRGANNGYRRSVEMDQWVILIPMFCVPTWRRFIDRLAIAGEIERPNYGVEWETPRFESVDPVKDSIADRNDVRSGFVSRRQVIQRRGDNPEKVTEAIAEDAAELDRLNLTLDTDPRKVSAAGLAQTDPKADKPAGAGDNGGNDAEQ